MRLSFTLPIAAAIGVALGVGCAGVAGGTTKRSPPMAEQESLDAQEMRGRIVFMKHCNACHPQGEGGIGGTLSTKPLPETAVKIKVRTGLGLDMPSFGEDVISTEDLDALTEYVESMRANDPYGDQPDEIDDD